MATHTHTTDDYFATAHVCKVCMTKENADLRTKLEEAERKLKDASDLCGAGPDLLISREYYEELRKKLLDAELRGADAARREAMRICNEIAYDEEGMHVRPDASECGDAIEERLGAETGGGMSKLDALSIVLSVVAIVLSLIAMWGRP